jgi:hypothetical protein
MHLGCLSGTRTNVLSEITTWFDDRSAPNVLWLCGAPGTGKTTISRSLIANLKRQQRLAGVFFFGQREYPQVTPFKLWPTVAYQMASFHPAIETAIHGAIATRTNETMDSNDVNSTYRKLVSDPLKATNGLLSNRGPVFLIDGLEKCSRDQMKSWEALLETLAQWPSSLPHCKLIITSQPQSDITNAFGCRDLRRIDLLTGDDVDWPTKHDVRTYLNHCFAEMRKQDNSNLENWPDYNAISKLVDHTRGFFRWAVAAVNDIKAAGDRKRHLATIIQDGTTTKFDHFDLYIEKILKTALGSNPTEDFRATVGTIALSEQLLTMADLKHFLQSRSLFPSRPESPDDMCYRLLPIVSIKGESKTIKFRHQAYKDYLIDSKRCTLFDGEFRSKTHRKMTISCLKIMQQGLKFNICRLKSSYKMNRDIEGRGALVEKCIPSHLAYACQHWAHHLRGIDPTEERNTAIFYLLRKFLNYQLLYWLEVLSLLSKSHLASTSLLAAAKWLEVYQPSPSVPTVWLTVLFTAYG